MATKREQTAPYEGYYIWDEAETCSRVLHLTAEDEELYRWLEATKADWAGFRKVESLAEVRGMVETYYRNWHRDVSGCALAAYDREDPTNLEVLEDYASWILRQNKGDAYDVMEYDKECDTEK